jgi:hypothetical protein
LSSLAITANIILSLSHEDENGDYHHPSGPIAFMILLSVIIIQVTLISLIAKSLAQCLRRDNSTEVVVIESGSNGSADSGSSNDDRFVPSAPQAPSGMTYVYNTFLSRIQSVTGERNAGYDDHLGDYAMLPAGEDDTDVRPTNNSNHTTVQSPTNGRYATTSTVITGVPVNGQIFVPLSANPMSSVALV